MPVVDLFCGCGGLSKGFELADFDVVAAFDHWQSAITCYNANFQHDAHFLDLSDVDLAVENIRPYMPTMIIGGPPCQEFSTAGKREEGNLADLTIKYAEIITQLRPQYFVMENVSRARQSQAYAQARQLYKQNNYGLTEIVLDASRCNAPQKRLRFFCIGSLNEPDNFLLENLFQDYTGVPISVAEYFREKHLNLDITAYYRHPTTYTRRAVFSVDEVAPTIRGVNRPKPRTYVHHANDAVTAEELANIRQLSLRERATIQTFSRDFVFEGLGISNCDLEQMIGNAVPVALSNFVARILHNYINRGNEAMDERYTFSEWLRNEKNYTDRTISDVFSRIKRAAEILPTDVIDLHYIVDLEQREDYKILSSAVRSQIKKALKLKIEFSKLPNIDN